MASTKHDGKAMAFKFSGFTFPAGHLTSVDWPRSKAVNDVTGATQFDKEYIDSERDSTITVNAWDDIAQTIRVALLITLGQNTVDYWPQGAATGLPKRSALLASITGVSDPLTHNAPAPITITFQVSGAITETTVSP